MSCGISDRSRESSDLDFGGIEFMGDQRSAVSGQQWLVSGD